MKIWEKNEKGKSQDYEIEKAKKKKNGNKKVTIWTLQNTNKGYYARNYFAMASKRKPEERNGIAFIAASNKSIKINYEKADEQTGIYPRKRDNIFPEIFKNTPHPAYPGPNYTSTKRTEHVC